MDQNDKIFMPCLKARTAQGAFVVGMFDKARKTEGAMKVVNSKSNDTFEVCTYLFCAEDTLR